MRLYIYAIRFFKCLRFNHFSKDCIRDKVYSVCAKTNNDDGVKCINTNELKFIKCLNIVSRYNLRLDVNHCAFSKECQSLQREFEKIKKSHDINK